MFDEDLESLLRRAPEAKPSPDAKSRVLTHCQMEMEKRRERHRKEVRWRWGLAFGIVFLLLANTVAEYQFTARISQIMAEPRWTSVGSAPNVSIAEMRSRIRAMSDLSNDPAASASLLPPPKRAQPKP
jgi:hypothetical protein